MFLKRDSAVGVFAWATPMGNVGAPIVGLNCNYNESEPADGRRVASGAQWEQYPAPIPKLIPTKFS